MRGIVMKIAVIPARGGSKRIPRKNIREFSGRPMIAWAISAAKASALFNRVIVSTDDEEIADLAKSLGAEAPFVRPARLADDLTPTVPVVAHAVEWCIDSGLMVDYACCIYPCAPFLQVNDLIKAFELVQAANVDFVYPVAEYAHPIQRAMRQLEDGKMQFLTPEYELTRTQDLEKTYHDAGQFYWGKTSAWLEQKRMHSNGVGMPLPSWRVVDIDTEDDWERAQILFKQLNGDR